VKHFIATYDIEPAPGEPHQRFLEAAMRQGWRDTLSIAGETEQLPSCTLVGEFIDLEQANRSFDTATKVATALAEPAKINVERRYIVERVPAGRLKAMRGQWVKTNIARLNKLLRPKTPSA
jgi:hypothetical protein